MKAKSKKLKPFKRWVLYRAKVKVVDNGIMLMFDTKKDALSYAQFYDANIRPSVIRVEVREV